MLRIQRLLLASALATVVFLTGCGRQEASQHGGATVDAAAIARADALISQPAWLRERLPENTVAYARIPSLWGTLSAPDGRALDAALATEQHAKLIAELRKALQTDPLIAQTEAGSAIELLLGDQLSPIEVAVLDSSGGVTPFSRALVTVVLDIPDVAALNARIAALSAGKPTPLQTPVDAHGDAVFQRFGALHFDAATHRLFLSLGTTSSALTLQQDLAQLQTTRAHPMQDAEREMDQSGQGLFAWMSMKGLNSQLEAQLQNQPPDGLLRDALEHTQSVALGWGTVDGHGRLQVQIRAPQAHLLGYLAPIAGAVDLKTAGKPKWAFTMALPGNENLHAILDNLDRDWGAGTRAQFDAGMSRVQAKLGIDPVAFTSLFGPQWIAFSDANGSYSAVQVRDRKALYARLDELGQRFGWQNGTTRIGDLEVHHLRIPFHDEADEHPDSSPGARAAMRLVARLGTHLYWVEEGDWLVFASVPQLLVDRAASRPDVSLGAWLDSQSYDAPQALLGFAVATHDMQRKVYYLYLQMLQIAGDLTGHPVDLSTMPSNSQLKLPVEGATNITVQANDQRLAVQVGYEQSPVELLGGSSMMTTTAVISILAAISISQYQDYVIRSQVSEGSALADGVKTAVAEYYQNRGGFPPANADAGLANGSSIQGAYVSSVNVADGVITATYSSTPQQKANSALNGKSLRFRPILHPGSIEWHCESDDLKQKWCSSSCECKG